MDIKARIMKDLEQLNEEEREELLEEIRKKYMEPETWWNKGGDETYEEW
ncbi:hypothetical protein [Salimicrobium flavidum]|uniref:Uncharacterized protein n=1 Tax=Salimicrobium flavidum TaxID=570947 RepID=A0A1N7J9A2_9BACI|nr:hypothetical protein [Salimicrobium flavidum]SIS45933.1 hypothetical protein SAMN05421687_104204 [Salimicrobium flavidum]